MLKGSIVALITPFEGENLSEESVQETEEETEEVAE